jgi:hypothetical protein
MTLIELALVIAGTVTLAGAVMNWDWFMKSRRAKLFVDIMGPKGARVFYGMLGFLMIAMGVLRVIEAGQ